MHSRSTVFIESLEPRALLAAGAIDSSYSPPFNNVGNSPFAFDSVVHMQFDGKSIHCANINDKQTLWRQNPNGSLDTSFGTRGKVVLNQKDHVGDMTVAPDGRILVYYFRAEHKIHVARYTANGAPDRTFGGDGDVSITTSKAFLALSIVVRNDGKILLGGEGGESDLSSSSAAIYRLNSSGTLDNSFGTHGLIKLAGSVGFNDLDIRRSDNRIVAAGISGAHWKVWILAPSGAEEWSSGLDVPIENVSSSDANAVLVDGDGSIVVSGDVQYYVPDDPGPPRQISTTLVGRYPAPKSNAPFKFSYEVTKPIALAPDGKVFAMDAGDLVRLNYDMTQDSSFGESGKASIGVGAASIAIQGDGNILIDGSGDTYPSFGETRILGDSPTVLAYGKNKLKILGTSANDVINISKSAGLLAVSRNGAAPFYFTASKVKRLIIDAGSGDDTIILSKSVPMAIINGGDGNDTLIGKRRKDKTTSIEHMQ